MHIHTRTASRLGDSEARSERISMSSVDTEMWTSLVKFRHLSRSSLQMGLIIEPSQSSVAQQNRGKHMEWIIRVSMYLDTRYMVSR